jgi:hypothetical protein
MKCMTKPNPSCSELSSGDSRRLNSVRPPFYGLDIDTKNIDAMTIKANTANAMNASHLLPLIGPSAVH